jgi:hypothetical protein
MGDGQDGSSGIDKTASCAVDFDKVNAEAEAIRARCRPKTNRGHVVDWARLDPIILKLWNECNQEDLARELGVTTHTARRRYAMLKGR